MSIYKATKTMAAIEAAMEADQGAAYRVWLGKVIPHIGDAYRGADLPFRSHMGASGLGNECEAAIFYGFRWATKPHFDGRILRLFNRGHLEEARFIALLLMIGVQIYQQDENGKQFRISDAGGHLGGSGDGIAIGVPDLQPGQSCVTEFKTASDKKFEEFKSKGVREANFTYFVQMNLYMGKMGIPAALFCVVNKNTDELYMEIVPFDNHIYSMYLERGVRLVFTDKVPAKIPNASAGWFKCRFCDHLPVCHKGEAPYVTCRSCVHSKVEQNGTWTCNLVANNPVVKTSEEQYKACSEYKRAF